MLHINKKGRLPLFVGLMAIFAAGALTLSVGSAEAKKKKSVKSSWFKLCNKTPFVKIDKKTKKQTRVDKDLCLTAYESLHPNTGLLLVGAAVREIEGFPKKRFIVTVPLGLALKKGLEINIDDGKPRKLSYSFCAINGCTAEINADAKFLKQMKGGKKMFVTVFNHLGKKGRLQVPLNGFGFTLAGKPIDPKVYRNARKKLLEAINKRRAARLKELREKQGKK